MQLKVTLVKWIGSQISFLEFMNSAVTGSKIGLYYQAVSYFADFLLHSTCTPIFSSLELFLSLTYAVHFQFPGIFYYSRWFIYI